MTSRSNSRWNFLQQAVASVESRLDTILAEENEPPKRPLTPGQTSRESGHSKRLSADLSRSSSNASASNDRLQERLARAMAKKNASRTDSPAPVQDQMPEPMKTDDISVQENPQSSNIMSLSNDEGGETHASGILEPLDPDEVVPKADIASETDTPAPITSPTNLRDLDSPRISTDSTKDKSIPSPKLSEDVLRTSDDAVVGVETTDVTNLQEEMVLYIERIDALHAKLQYLSKEAAESAKQAAASASAETLEKKISEKDEKIALLIQEGTKLSKTEMAHLSTIKKIRAQVIASNKEQEAAKTRAEKAERALKNMEDRAKKAESSSKRAEQALAANVTGATDAQAVRRERDALQATLADMKLQLSKANLRAEAAETKAHSDQIEKERRQVAELQDDLTSAKVEREISEEKLRREIQDLRASLAREKEQSRAMESEMLSEQAILESKLESFRVRAEEATSADHGHLQAKLLRQIETLQSQHASASQNWQGIESTLLGRITALEKERDEVAARETDLRKKLRDVTLKLKNGERELDSIQNKYMDLDKALADANEECNRVKGKASQLETEFAEALKDLEDQKVSSERDLQQKIDEEKAKWTASLHIQRTESPGTSIRKGSNFGFDINHLMSPVQYERTSGRRPSAMPSFDSNTPPRQQSTTSFRALANGSGSIAETPTVVTPMDADEYFANVPPTPLSASHNSHRGVNDLVSTSTVGAGPSVQLVERMSANVRRLESEKAASKDEMIRITTQRDEARQEVVGLMREIEEKRKIEDRLRALETEHQSLSQRHQTTLELLGEKSEQVEELKADILDVKQMYRQLADTMK